MIFGHLNINSLRNEFEDLKEIIKQNVDILIISETKLDACVPTNQFSIEGKVNLFDMIGIPTEGVPLFTSEKVFHVGNL